MNTLLRTALVVGCFLLLFGCDEGETFGEGRTFGAKVLRGEAADASRVVARVDGVPILVGDVEDAVKLSRGELGPKEALDALIDQQLLAREAQRRGYDRGKDLEIERKRALVRSLLERVGEGVTAEDVPPEEIAAKYEKFKNTFVHDTLRDVVHAVVLTGEGGLDGDKAEEISSEIAVAVAGAEDLDSFTDAADAIRSRVGKGVKIENLPPFAQKDSGLDSEFVRRTFALDGPGSLSEPFETKFGWHVVLVLAELPPRDSSLEEASEEIARKLLPRYRKEATDRFLSDLKGKYDVKMYDRRIAEIYAGGSGG